MRDALVEPWLVAIWPGMGSVALTAGQHLVEELGARRIVDLPVSEFFDVEKVDIKQGVARVGWLPECRLYGWKNPGAGKDLLVFVGEAQPSQRGYEFCRQILQICQRYRVSRVFTFAAMATKIHPTAKPRVFGVTNELTLLGDLSVERVEILREGQISGLNGVMLVAAADMGVEGICLLGEIPFFAVSVPNPKASVHVLRVFSRMAGVPLDVTQLEDQAHALESRLVELIRRMNLSVAEDGETRETPDEFGLPDFIPADDSDCLMSPEDSLRIEHLFQEAERDRTKAVDLKNELDRLGAFGAYEDRFLDLFRPR